LLPGCLQQSKLATDLRAVQTLKSDLEFENSKLKGQVADAQGALFTSEAARNTLKSELEEAKKRLEAKEKESRRCLSARSMCRHVYAYMRGGFCRNMRIEGVCFRCTAFYHALLVFIKGRFNFAVCVCPAFAMTVMSCVSKCFG